MDIVVDCDGTIVTHEFPRMGKDIGAAPVLKKLIANGHNLILFTMRSDGEQGTPQYLTEAVEWFKRNDIPLYGIQVNPSQWSWTTSPKAYGQLIIDDAALGCPLTSDGSPYSRPYVDWVKVEEILISKGLIK